MISTVLSRLGSSVLLVLACSGCANMALQAQEPSTPAPTDVVSLETSLVTTGMPTPVKYATLGYAAVDRSCENYFGAVIKADNTLKMSKADIVATGSAAAVIVALASGPQKAIGITAAAFGLGSAVVDNYEQYAFATPYPIQTHQLVRKALVVYRQSAPPDAVVTIEDAYDKVAGYARNCTFAGIADLAEQALATSTPVDANKGKATFSTTDRSTYLTAIDALVAKTNSVPTDDDYATLAAMASTTDAVKFGIFLGTLSPAIDQAKIFSGGTAPGNETAGFQNAASLLKLLAASNHAFAAAINAKTDALSAPVTTGVAPSLPPPKALATPSIGIGK